MPGPKTSHDDIVRVIECHKIGLPTRDIAQQTGVHPRTIQNLVQKFKESGSADVPHHKKASGRPRKLSDCTLKIVKRQVDAVPSTSAKKIKFENPRLLGDVSVRTVQRRLSTDLGYKKVNPSRKPDISKRQVIARKLFAEKYKEWPLEKWQQVLWSDEASFFVSDTSGNKVWRGPQTDTLADNQVAKRRKFPQYVMV
ncbi:uncharacterized protein [Palaemon carinicauda]|uniref:uncharacterized protein n=1 Tax=Palaemon carinicauda TaxID=392227 RepID=UPI0035B6A10C